MEVVIFMGIQATGKSSFYKERFFNTHLRINLDMLKTRNREQILLEACIRAKQSLVVDNTNATVLARQKYIVQAKEACFKVVGYYFRSQIEEAVIRNNQREGKAKIPLAGIKSTHAKLEVPHKDEGFDELYFVYIDADGRFVVEEWQDEV